MERAVTLGGRARMLVAAHAPSDVPSDGFYLPVHCGHALNPVDLGYQPDDTGAHISERNREYSELTAVYWAWRNLAQEPGDLIGLSHYRRYFKGAAKGPGSTRILAPHDAARALTGADLVLAKPRNYVIETIESHYRNSHPVADLELLRDAVRTVSPSVAPALESLLAGRRLAQFHMFVMRRADFDRYCEWLFSVLGEVERHLDVAGRTPYQRRALGFLGERLLNAWAIHHQLNVVYLPVVMTEREPKVRKAAALVRRKLGATRS